MVFFLHATPAKLKRSRARATRVCGSRSVAGSVAKLTGLPVTGQVVGTRKEGAARAPSFLVFSKLN